MTTRTAVTVTDPAASSRLDVLLTVEPTSQVADLDAALRDLLPGARAGLWLGDEALDPTLTVQEAGIGSGAVLSLGGPLGSLREPAATHELRLVSGPDSGAIYLLPPGDTVVGGPGAGVCLTGAGISAQQLVLHNGPGGVVVTNLDPRNAVTRSGVPLSGPTAVGADDQLAVGGHLLAVVPAGTPGVPLARVGLSEELARPERSRPELATQVLEVPERPGPVAVRGPAVVAVAIVIAGALLLAALVSRWFLLLGVLAPAGGFALWLLDQRRALREQEEGEAAYHRAVSDVAAQRARLVRSEQAERRALAPDAAVLLRAATCRGPQLWERRPADPDALSLRIGTAGALASSFEVVDAAGSSRDPLADVPVSVSLRDVGVLGVSAPAVTGRGTARWLVAQAAVLHSPQDLSIWLLADPRATTSALDWSWVRWLPHAAGPPRDCAVLIGTTTDTVAARVAELTALVAHRMAMAAEAGSTQGPDLLVVLDGAPALSALPGVAELLRDGPAVRVHFLCLGDPSSPLPEACATLVAQSGGRVALRRTGGAGVEDVRAELVSVVWADRVARALAPVRLAGAARTGPDPLPDAVPLPELLGEVSPEALRARWAPAPVLTPGHGPEGPIRLDLSTDGPHLLLAGSDREAMARLMRTVIGSLAASCAPEQLSFVLVGADPSVFGECLRLPHLSATLTGDDGAVTARALASLMAEVRRREQQRPASRLVVVVDDVSSQPAELVQGLTAVARQGGPAGVHLVATAQQPRELPAPLLALLTLRVSLRLDDPRDAAQVLGSPAAAALRPGAAGRGYLRAANGPLVPFQGATGGALPASGAAPVAQELPWDRLGQPLVERDGGDESAIEALAEAARAVGGAPAPSPWLDPLPDRLTLAELGPRAGGDSSSVLIGLEDLPDEQRQQPAAWDVERDGHLLVLGSPDSGRTTVLRTLAASLATTASPADVHLYVLDGDPGGGGLAVLEALPHCGAVVGAQDVDRADRLLARLASDVARRGRLLAQRGHADLSEQRARTADPLPFLVLLLDSWDGFVAGLAEQDRGRLTDLLLQLLAEGAPAGVRVVVTGGPALLATDLAALLPDRLVLRLDERTDYAGAGLLADTVPTQVPAGRAFHARTGLPAAALHAVQVALLAGEPSEHGQVRALSELAAGLPRPRGRKPFRVDVLPDVISLAEAQALGTAGSGAAEVAVGGEDLRLQTVNLATCGPGFTVAGPPRSGRSTALLVLSRSLLAGGAELCLLTPRPSPLRQLAGQEGVLLAADKPEPGELAQALERAGNHVVVVVDDAEEIDDAQVGGLLEEVLGQGRSRGRSVVLASETDHLAGQSAGFAFLARRSRSGLLLSPSSVSHGELLGLRLPPALLQGGPPGRGLLVRTGQELPVQVPLP